MKTTKYLFPVLALGSLLLTTSCQMEDPEPDRITGEVDLTITAGIPGGISTYAPAGTGSHNGGAVLLDPDAYDLRYIMQAYDETDKLAYSATKYVSDNFTTQSVVFEARLIAKKYKFVFWADFVENGKTEDYYYKTVDDKENIDLRNITYATDPVFTDDAMDAYTKVVEVDLSAQNQNISEIKLQRPFGKLRLIATDQLSGDLQNDELPASTEIEYADETTVPNAFDALEGLASGSMKISTVSSTSMQEDAVVNGTTYEGAYFLIANYIFASDANTGYAMDVTVKDKAGKPTGTRSLSQIPIVKNKLTTVIGNFYSNSSTLEVIVEDPFEQPGTEIPIVDNEQELIDALKDGEPYVTLSQDLNVTSEITLALNNQQVELNLNGHTLVFTEKTNNDDIKVGGNGTLTIKDGKIVAEKSESYIGGISAIGSSEVILDGVEYNTTGVALFVRDAGKLTVRNSEINAGAYCVTSNASNPLQKITVVLDKSSFTGSSAILLNIPSEISITDCDIVGDMHGTVIRGGTAIIENSRIALEYNDGDYENIVHYFDNINWGSGNMVNLAAITIGNKAPNAYQYPTNVTLKGTELLLKGTYGSAFPALYAYANQGEGLGVTLKFDDNCTFAKMPEYGSTNIVVNGVNPIYNRTKSEAYTSIQDAVNAADANDNITLAAGLYNNEDGLIINKPITIIGEGEKTVLKSATGLWSSIWLKEAAQGSSIDGITVYGAYKNNGDNVSNAITVWAKDVTVQNCVTLKPESFADGVNGYIGISTTYGDFSGITIKNNRIEDTRYGMYFNSISDAEISDNVIKKTAYAGIVIASDSETYPCKYVSITNNDLSEISWFGYEDPIYAAGITIAGLFFENVTQQYNTVDYSETANPEVTKNPVHGF